MGLAVVARRECTNAVVWCVGHDRDLRSVVVCVDDHPRPVETLTLTESTAGSSNSFTNIPAER